MYNYVSELKPNLIEWPFMSLFARDYVSAFKVNVYRQFHSII